MKKAKSIKRNFTAIDKEWAGFQRGFDIRTPGNYARAWLFNERHEIHTQTALAMARFIAGWNGYKLVKEK